MFEDSKLNFSEALDKRYKLNFGAEDKDEDLLVYQYPLNLEFYHYNSIYTVLDKYFIDDKQEVKTIRMTLVDKGTTKITKKFYGQAVKLGSEERYSFEAEYKKYKEGLTEQQFKDKYSFILEILITDVDAKGSAEVSNLVSNFKFYLKRGKNV